MSARERRRVLARVVLFVAIFVVGLTESSQAGTMTLYSCHTPSGRSVATDGWEPLGGRPVNSCAAGPEGTLNAEILVGSTTADTGWALTAAPNTTLEAFTAQVCGRVEIPTWTYVISIEDFDGVAFRPLKAAPQFGCVGPRPYCCNPENLVSGGGERVRLTRLHLHCYSPCGTAMRGEIAGFRADIGDYEPPNVSAVRGSLVTSSSQAGPETLEFDASDKGVGVFRAVAEARINRGGEWREIVSAPVQNGGKCTPVHETNYLFEFSAPQPCPTAVAAGKLRLADGDLPPGTHSLRVRLEDAAGNSKLLIEPRAYSVTSPAEHTPPLATVGAQPGLTGVPAPIALAGSASPQPVGHISISRPRARGLRSSGSFTIQGRLLDVAGTPLPRAVVFIQSRSYFPKLQAAGRPWTSLGSSTTDKEGTFRAHIPAGPSRSIKVTYGYGASAAVAQAEFTVPATVDLRAERTRVRNGRSAVFRGRVAGPIPSGGVFVALEVREPNRWVPVATTRRWVKTSNTGTFTLAYRFLRTFQPATYRFRVVADEDSAFQYRRGTSRALTVHVRP
jgi:hypothetical protein